MPPTAPTDPTPLPSLAYAKPERFLIPPGRDVVDADFGRFVLRYRHPFYAWDFGPTKLRETLRRVARILNSPANFSSRTIPNWWIGVGTALGFARENNFVAGDTDIDVRMGLDYKDNRAAFDAAATLVQLFERHGFRLMRESHWDGRPMQTAFADLDNHEVIFDIYYFYAGISEGRYVNANENGYRRKPRHLIDNKRTRFWPGYASIKINVPHPVEDYLEWRFGPEWRIPKKNSELGPIDNRCIEPLPRVTVLTYGTWDLFHHGHQHLLERAAEVGDHLVVGVVPDQLCHDRGKYPAQTEEQRAARIREIPFVREVFIQRLLDQKETDIERFGVSHLVVGDDWKDHPRFEQVRNYRGVQLHYLPRTPGISSTDLRQKQAIAKGV